MCLDKVTMPRKLKSEGTGYKMFYKTKRGNLKFSYFRKDSLVPTGKWINEKKYRLGRYKERETINAMDGTFYPMGFHLYMNKRLAEAHIYSHYRGVIVPVKFRGACAKGKQLRMNVIIAKEIFIQKEI